MLLKERKRNIYSSPSKFENFEEGSKNSDTNQKSINFQGGKMPENYTRLFQDLLGWLGQTFNEEIANQTAAELEKMKTKTKYLNSSGNQDSSKQSTEANDSVQGVDVSQSKEFQELQKKLELLERDNNEMKFNEYLKSQSGRLVPAQKQIVKLAFEAVSNKSEGFQFAENGKMVSINGEALIKKLIESFPMQVEFNELARKDTFGDSSELEEQNKFIDEYNKNK
jgi:hypothetical protein